MTDGSASALLAPAGVAPPPAALYLGHVMHQRLRPFRHRLRYAVYALLLDLDRVAEMARPLRLLSLDRFNLFGWRAADHGEGDPAGPRAFVDRHLAEAGLETGGTIRLLAMPRVLGYAFNPLSVYFCHRADGALQAVLYEVHNTFGERHAYLVEAGPADPSGLVRQRCAKVLHVSPFLDRGLQYRFRLRPPDADGRGRLSVGVDACDDAGPLLLARFDATARPLGDAALLRAFFGHPLLTLKVTAGIHWEALRLWRKGAVVRPHPAPPATFVSWTPLEAQGPAGDR